jgi:mono/diheme cytochrome c family protein
MLALPVAALLAHLHGNLELSLGALSASPKGDTVITRAMIVRGDSIFHGKLAGGLCFTCHGSDARGIAGLGPNLTDDKWLHGDGSYDFLVSLVERGVPKPKQSAAPMLPKGGANLTAEQVRAVAAYVFSLSHKIP